MGKKRKKMRGTVEKIIKPVSPMEPEKAQITIPEADDLYREVRVENVVRDLAESAVKQLTEHQQAIAAESRKAG
jgi:hypothetical protein